MSMMKKSTFTVYFNYYVRNSLTLNFVLFVFQYVVRYLTYLKLSNLINYVG